MSGDSHLAMKMPALRRLGPALLIAYGLLIALAAWRHEIRPRALDPLSAFSRAALQLLGVPPGVAVFSAEVTWDNPEKLADLCLEVRGVDAGGRVHRLHPDPDEPCPPSGVRWWVEGETIWLNRAVVSMRVAAAAQRTDPTRGPGPRFPRLLSESIADHFRARARAAGLPIERYALLWTESHVNVRSGERRWQRVALMRWQRDPESGVFLAWRPAGPQLREGWPELSAP